MNFLVVIAILFAISFIWALFSVLLELRKPREIDKVKKELAKERVIFHR